MKQNLRHQDTFNIYIYILTFTQHDLIFNLLLMIFICHAVWFVTNKRHNDEIIKRESQNYLFFHIFRIHIFTVEIECRVKTVIFFL